MDLEFERRVSSTEEDQAVKGQEESKMSPNQVDGRQIRARMC